MKPLGSIAALVAAVRDDAAAEAESIESEAATTIVRILADADGCATDDTDQRAVDAARDRARVRVAQEDWEDARDAIAEREVWMRKAIELGVQRLRDPRTLSERSQTLTDLARQAIARLPAGPIEVVVSEADAAALDHDWRAALVAPADPDTVRIVTAEIDGGCVVRSADGRASFDNTFAARAQRLQSSWRAALADIYEGATSGLSARAVPPSEG